MLTPFKNGDIFDDHYRLLRPLSNAGGTADVWLAIDLNTIDDPVDADDTLADTRPDESTAMQVAIKIYRPQNALDIEGEQRFRDEFKIVYNCHHSNLLQPTHFAICGETPYLVMPYCSRGSSEQLAGQLSKEADIWKYVGDVAAGLAYLHAMEPPIVHQDIKPANVLIDDNGNYAITDFGISVTRDRHQQHDFSGTQAYMAPERFIDETPLAASDIYALGVTLFELITGHVPFGENGGKDQPEGAVQLNFLGRNVPASIKRLITDCLDRNPQRRPTAAQLAEAARLHAYPVSWWRTHRWTATSIATACVIAVAAILAAHHMKKQVVEPEPVNVEALFQEAQRMVSSSNPDTISAGMVLMDSVARTYNYTPAFYEISRTYGLMLPKDTAIYNHRRNVLGIKLGNKQVQINCNNYGDEVFDSLYIYFPASNDHISLANIACMRILQLGGARPLEEITDTTLLNQMKESAMALGRYHLLCYSEPDSAVKYLRICRKIAQQINDDAAVNNCDVWIEAIQKRTK